MIVGNTHMLVWTSPVASQTFVVCIHGLALCARAYKPLANELSAAGMSGFGVNVRGFGPDRVDPEHAKLDCVETVKDVSQLLKNIRHEYPGARIILLGESMGGALTLRTAAEYPELVDGVICSAPAWKLLKVRRTAAKGVFEVFLPGNRRPGPAARSVLHQATADPHLIEHISSDPSHKLKLSLGEVTAFFHFISDTDKYSKKMAKPVLIIQGLEDYLVSPLAVAKLFHDIPAPDKSFLVDATAEHLVLEEGRFSPQLMDKLLTWLKSESTPHAPQVNFAVINDKSIPLRSKQRLQRMRTLSGVGLPTGGGSGAE